MPEVTSAGIIAVTPLQNGQSPEILRVFEHHGIPLTWRPGQQEAQGVCPICGSDKFYANISTGQWNCRKGCWSGNRESLLSQIWELSTFPQDKAAKLTAERKLLRIETLEQWGLRWSMTTAEWIVPGYNATGKIVDLYRYARDVATKKYRWISTPGMHHGLWGVPLFSPEKQRVLVNEGIWDGMSLWEIVGHEHNVLATPSATVFKEEWGHLTSGKTVCLMYDNDYPKEHPQTKQAIESVGFSGMKRATGILRGLAQSLQPKEIFYLWWGADGYTKDHKDGYDVRDHIALSNTPEERQQRVSELIASLAAAPAVWPVIKMGNEELTPLKCESWKMLREAFEDALEWSPGLDKALTVMLASVISTMMVGDCPLWVKVMAPASSAKTVLCEALSVSKWIESRDHFTGLHSAFKAGKNDDRDHSLLPKLMDKTFIIKEANTLLSAANKEALLGELRAAYDGASRIYWKTGVDRTSTNYRFTMIIAGTGSLKQLDSAELGARYVDVIIIEKIEEKWERKVNRKVALRSLRNLGTMANGSAATSQDSLMVKAKRLCGGYVNYLRENAGEILGRVKMTPEDAEHVIDCAEFVAFMRARQSKTQNEITEREFSARLVEQYMKLAQCLTGVMGKTVVDKSILNRVKEVALDTAQGTTLEIVKYLYHYGSVGADGASIQQAIGGSDESFQAYIRFLRRIEVVEVFRAVSKTWQGTRTRYRLTDRVTRLYTNITRMQ